MKFSDFKKAKTLSLANLLSHSNYALANELKQCDFKYISCFYDEILGKDNLIKCEIGSISYVLALICKNFGVKNEYFNELDDGFLSGECSVGEEEFDELSKWLKDAQNVIIDSSFFTHKDAKMLFEFLEILNLNVIVCDSDIKNYETNSVLSELKELDNFDGSVIYQEISATPYIKGGANFATASKIKDGDLVEISDGDFKLSANFMLDLSQNSTIAFVGVSKINGYNFRRVIVRKI